MKVDVESVGSFQKRITLTVPPERVSGELEKAYKQAPNFPAMMRWTVICIWSTLTQTPVFYIAQCQLFGGKSPPLNFARYPAWLTEVAAAIFGLPITAILSAAGLACLRNPNINPPPEHCQRKDAGVATCHAAN